MRQSGLSLRRYFNEFVFFVVTTFGVGAGRVYNVQHSTNSATNDREKDVDPQVMAESVGGHLGFVWEIGLSCLKENIRR